MVEWVAVDKDGGRENETVRRGMAGGGELLHSGIGTMLTNIMSERETDLLLLQF